MLHIFPGAEAQSLVRAWRQSSRSLLFNIPKGPAMSICQKCFGRGYVGNDVCWACRGTGRSDASQGGGIMTPSLAASLLCGIAAAVFALYGGSNLESAGITGAIVAIIVQFTVAKPLAAMLGAVINVAGWIAIVALVAFLAGLI